MSANDAAESRTTDLPSIVLTREEELECALRVALATIKDYLAYGHDGDPWREDARTMGEMDINDYETDGRMAHALSLLGDPAP